MSCRRLSGRATHHFRMLLPSIIAASFCRGLRIIQMRGMGRALRGAEVWKCCGHHVSAGPPGGGGLGLGTTRKHTLCPPLEPSDSCGRVQMDARRVDFVMWGNNKQDFSLGLQICRFRVRCEGRRAKRLILTKLPQSKAIVLRTLHFTDYKNLTTAVWWPRKRKA